MSDEETMGEKMRDLTIKMLKNNEYYKKCLSPAGAIFNEEIGKKNILVLGLNPAGNKDDVTREKNCKIFLNYVKYKKQDKEYELKGKLVNNGYFKPIYNLVNEVYKYDKNDKNGKDKANFSWKNRKFDDIKKEIEKLKNIKDYEKTINNFELNINDINKIAKPTYTILIGDLFYYHETSSKDFIKKINNKDKKGFSGSIKEMLDLHIKKVLSKGKTLEFILINNARASEYVIEALEGPITCCGCDYQYEDESHKESIPIFFSGMLSNGGESKYGKQRLINEIKQKKGIT